VLLTKDDSSVQFSGVGKGRLDYIFIVMVPPVEQGSSLILRNFGPELCQHSILVFKIERSRWNNAVAIHGRKRKLGVRAHSATMGVVSFVSPRSW